MYILFNHCIIYIYIHIHIYIYHILLLYFIFPFFIIFIISYATIFIPQAWSLTQLVLGSSPASDFRLGAGGVAGLQRLHVGPAQSVGHWQPLGRWAEANSTIKHEDRTISSPISYGFHLWDFTISWFLSEKSQFIQLELSKIGISATNKDVQETYPAKKRVFVRKHVSWTKHVPRF
jgi:hypothetical protein